MKKIYVKPSADIVAIASERKILENSGVGSNPFAKETEFEEENETGIPTTFTNVWGEEEKED